MRLFAC
jgi:hypothetical protein